MWLASQFKQNSYAQQYVVYVTKLVKKRNLLTNLMSIVGIVIVSLFILNSFVHIINLQQCILLAVSLSSVWFVILHRLNSQLKKQHIETSQNIEHLVLFDAIQIASNRLKQKHRSSTKETSSVESFSNSKLLLCCSMFVVFISAIVLSLFVGLICFFIALCIFCCLPQKSTYATLDLEQLSNVVAIPNYDSFEADWLFSYDSFGESSKRQFKLLLKCSMRNIQSNCAEFHKAQQLYEVFLKRLEAYHKARTIFENLTDAHQKTQKEFNRILTEELIKIQKKMQIV